MSNKSILFKSKERKNRIETADFLRQLADKVEKGAITLKQTQDEISLNLPANITLDVEVKDKDKGEKGIQHQLEIEIKWYDEELDAGPLELE